MRFLAGLLLVGASALAQPAVPFTVIQVSRQFDASGTLKSESRFLFAMNRDGSIVSVDLDPNAQGTRQVVDVLKHRTSVISPSSRSVSIGPYSQPPPASQNACGERFGHISGGAVSLEPFAGTIQGVAVQRVSVSIPDGTTMEVFMAPSLGCQMLRSQMSRNGVVLDSQTAEDLQIGAPDPQLFEVPADYRVTEATFRK